MLPIWEPQSEAAHCQAKHSRDYVKRILLGLGLYEGLAGQEYEQGYGLEYVEARKRPNVVIELKT